MARTRVGLFLTKEEETKLEEWCQERTTSTRLQFRAAIVLEHARGDSVEEGGGVVRGPRRSMMAMQDPPHPGGIVRRQCLEPLGLSVTRAAQGLGVTRQALSEVVNGRTGVSVYMAVRLSKAFGSTPETWLGMQMAYDLWQARDRADQIKVESFAAAGQLC